MVMEPGGYRFGDYWKLGLPLLALFGTVAVLLVPADLVLLSMETLELEDDPGRYVSTGDLPSPDDVRAVVSEAYERYGTETRGERSRVYPALARVPADLFGICVAGTTGQVYGAGDAEVPFTIMSVAKPFVFALVCQALGPEEARRTLGVNATGFPFNSVVAVERSPDGRTNPMVNAGAIATTSLVPGAGAEERWQTSCATASRASPAARSSSTRRSTRRPRRRTTATRGSRASSRASGASRASPPRRPTSTRGRAASRSPRADLAVMGATLAGGGVNPVTGSGSWTRASAATSSR